MGSTEPTGVETLEVSPSREAMVGPTTVRRALPQRTRRTVGAWCFVDHAGPVVGPGEMTAGGIGPHPHMGLHTVTWLLAGELRHRDSLGSEQVIRPGQLNLMTAGNGIAHAEEPTDHHGRFHGVQLWVAQPERTRHGDAAFEHHAELPKLSIGNGEATVLVGTVDGIASAARRDTALVGIDLALHRGDSVIPLTRGHEHAVVVLEGAVEIDGTIVTPGHLAYLGTARDELAVRAREPARALLIGGEPFESPVFMWWNFVARSRDEVQAAQRSWNTGDGRFGSVDSSLDRIPAPDIPWTTST